MSTPEESLHEAGPGGICDDCGHFAYRHNDMTCEFPPDLRALSNKGKPCTCQGMLWQGKRIEMDPRTGPVSP